MQIDLWTSSIFSTLSSVNTLSLKINCSSVYFTFSSAEMLIQENS